MSREHTTTVGGNHLAVSADGIDIPAASYVSAKQTGQELALHDGDAKALVLLRISDVAAIASPSAEQVYCQH